MFLIFTTLLVSNCVHSKNFSVDIQTLGKSHLQLSKNWEVTIEDFEEVTHETHREWKTRIVLKWKGKTVFQKYPIEEGTLDSSRFYFVPIIDEKYLVDIDDDGQKEFAVVYGHGGNAPTTSVTIFSLAHKRLRIFKRAWYLMEGGRSVIWDKKDVPQKCLYTSEGVCK